MDCLTEDFSSVDMRGIKWNLFSWNVHFQILGKQGCIPLHSQVKMPEIIKLHFRQQENKRQSVVCDDTGYNVRKQCYLYRKEFVSLMSQNCLLILFMSQSVRLWIWVWIWIWEVSNIHRPFEEKENANEECEWKGEKGEKKGMVLLKENSDAVFLLHKGNCRLYLTTEETENQGILKQCWILLIIHM